MSNRYKPILPAPLVPKPPAHGAPASPSIPPSSGTLRSRRVSVRVACNGCRAKRTACDGGRPICGPCMKRGSACLYVSATATETPAMVMKREMETLRNNYDKLAEAFDLLRTLPEERSLSVLRNLARRTTIDPAGVLTSVRGGGNPDDDALPRQVLARPPPQDSEEFELMLRHAVAYPALLPLDAATVSITTFFPGDPLVNSNAVQEETNRTASQSTSSQPSPGFHSPASSSHHPDIQPSTNLSNYCDPRLLLLNISFWCQTSISNSLAATLISLYLETDHPTLGLFDDGLFLDDLIGERIRYCTPLLVCSIIGWASHAYSALVPNLDSVTDAFLAEANVLWQIEEGLDSLPTVAASQLLSLDRIYNGDDGGMPYLSVGSHMAQRMGLFGSTRSGAPFPTGHEPATSLESWDTAAAHTAWGVYNNIAMHAFMFQRHEPALEFPPLLRVPGGASDRQRDEYVTDGAISTTLPDYMGRTFPAMCGFWVLTGEWAARYYTSVQVPVVGRVPWSFAESMFEKLLAWSDGLHFRLARGDQSSHHITILHIWYHASILELFRPFAQVNHSLPHHGFTMEDSMKAQARCVASLNQLKHMTLVFRYTYPCASYAIFWHMALLHVANAALQDTTDPQSKAYFRLCVNCYGDLFMAFRVAEGIVRSLLSIALRKGAMTGAEAQALLQRVRGNGPRYQNLKTITATFVVDLNLAVTDREGAQVESLADMFDNLRLFDEFIYTDESEEPNLSGIEPSPVADGV